jgi:cytochrome c1
MRVALFFPTLALALFGCTKTPPSTSATGGNPQRGLSTISSYGCGACHWIDGVPNADGLVGPSLQRIGERSYIAGRLANTPENLELRIRHPREVDLHTAMPELGVTQLEARDIVAYLYTQ